MLNDIPLVLGGHSFIQQLGNDPMPSPDEQVAIVEACLNAGIHWFDTTYQPERVALGTALKRLGRRSEATIIAWNFFKTFGAGEDVGGPEAFQPAHIDQMLDELQSDHIDVLIVHPVKDAAENARQLKLACDWREQRRVKSLGVWAPEKDCGRQYALHNPYTLMVRPLNVLTPGLEPGVIFSAAKQLGWTTLACSPFVRGWHLDKMIQAAVSLGMSPSEARDNIADVMLRFSLFYPCVDRLIVSIRKKEWIARNLASFARGELEEHEQEWIWKVAALAK
jgi:aryl-alcohol dehydrogenase-like predicted oxidoreductase